MTPKALIDLGAELVRQVLQLDAPADTVTSNFFRKHRNLGPRERASLADTVYELLRRKRLIQHLAHGGPGAAERRWVALAWQGNADFLQAALNAEEQTWLQAAAQFDADQLAEPLRHNLPDWLAQRLEAEVPAGGFWPLAEALNQPAPLDLRVNLLKSKRAEVLAELERQGVSATATPYSPWGLRLTGKPQLQRLSLFTQGTVEVQDEGSQLLALLTGAGRGEMVADFCAGAGGKTLALGAMMRNTGRLYALDVAAHRLSALQPRLARSGLSNVHTLAIAHENDERLLRLAGKMDRVLVDAPCSGLGTLRRNPDLKWRQNEAALAELQDRQLAILKGACRLLRSGGRLVFATCSLLRGENEAVAAAFTDEQKSTFERLDVADILQTAQVTGAETLCAGGDLRLWPHLHGTDGFFAAAWRRK